MRGLRIASGVLGLLVGASHLASAQAPALVQNSNLRVVAEKVGSMPFVLGPGFFGPAPNLASPVAIGAELLLVDHNDGIYTTQGSKLIKQFSVSNAPAGLTLTNRESILTASPDAKAKRVFVVFTSPTLPSLAPIPVYELPLGDPDYFLLPTFYHVLYEFEFKNNQMKNPRPIAAFETQFGPTHTGGGILPLDDDRLLLVLGDALTFGRDGSIGAQDGSSHCSKMLIVNPADGTYEIAAQGLRNVQHLQYVDTRKGSKGEILVAFADIGGVTAEELNVVPLADLLSGTIQNFGWGRNADGKAREGNFYIGPGISFAPGQPAVLSFAPTPEAGFIQPVAQYGRESATLAAITGPVISSKSFGTITAMFGDLNGAALATTGPLNGLLNPVYRVNLVDEQGTPTSFNALAGGRADPRFFVFPDGKAGVLLEATGEIYRLTQIADLP